MPVVVPPFPREIERDPPAAERLRARLLAAAVPLWSGASLAAPRMDVPPALADRIGRAAREGALVVGLEAATARLEREARGLTMADARSGGPRPARVSRLLLVADDGAERFYRTVERVLRRYGHRLLVCRLTLDAVAFGGVVTGRPVAVKAVLVEDKRVVVELLATIGADPPRAA